MRFDTPDLVLERHGLKLELFTDGSEQLWRATLARGETVEATGSSCPPGLERFLQTLITDRELQPVPVRSESPTVARLERALEHQRHSLLRHEPGARLAEDAENLHQLRVAARRVRTFLRVGRELVDPAWSGRVADALKQLGRATGPLRDLDVLAEHVREQVSSLDETDKQAAAALIAQLEDERRLVQSRLHGALDAAAYRSMLDLLSLPVVPLTAQPSGTLEELASRELRRLVRRVRRLGKTPPEEKLHALRIRVKRVRYAVELGGLPSGMRARRLIETATVLQDILGEHQDAAVAEERLRDTAVRNADTTVAFVAGRLAERQRQRRAELALRLPEAWIALRRCARKS